MHADPYLPIFERTQTIAIVGLSPKPDLAPEKRIPC